MRLLQGPAFDEIFRTYTNSVFHLEVEDSYHTSAESEPFRKFLRAEPDDFAWHQPWLELVRESTRKGRRVERVRVVSVPHVDYTRWGMSVASLNIEAGEDIRWLPRDRTHGMDLTSDDFWLVDGSRVVFTVFTPEGEFSGGAETTDPVIVERCVRVRDRVWEAAIAQADYVDS